jgi:folylpolyglutamate synthase/dihydropteroate synthase
VRLLVGLLDDKKVQDYLAVFDTPQFQIMLTRAPGHRGADPEALAKQITMHYATLTCEANLMQAFERVGQGDTALGIVGGSLRMAALAREYFGLLDAEALTEAQATRALFEGGDYLAKLSS